jgi:hypothetical protein
LVVPPRCLDRTRSPARWLFSHGRLGGCMHHIQVPTAAALCVTNRPESRQYAVGDSSRMDASV